MKKLKLRERIRAWLDRVVAAPLPRGCEGCPRNHSRDCLNCIPIEVDPLNGVPA